MPCMSTPRLSKSGRQVVARLGTDAIWDNGDGRAEKGLARAAGRSPRGVSGRPDERAELWNPVSVPHQIEPDTIHITPLTREHAEDISTWAYDAPYDVYDMVGVNPDELLDPEVGYHAVMAEDRLIGFRSFGPDGQVPGWEYDDCALDTGGGVRSELIGQGLGRTVISAGLAFGRARFAPVAFRVTVASFNARALHTVAPLGFERVGSFKATRVPRDFDVLVRVEAR